ncbi:hypothetical protein M9978_19330 [Sphingomonas sp. MG17]|uniref:Uncharacterized protein n=1 Tax=Sphingomonas tagetis TaxID=2949092 RepID=A0A9X2KN83_9SPHN|nr:hypothetical protein [Sphingomonas tagetis]MCP3732580.1 hypothetical protein [Sphingomonas tagetis]
MHSNLHEEINRFLSAHDSDQLQERLEAATHDLGFKWYAMGHHVDLRGSPEDALPCAAMIGTCAFEAGRASRGEMTRGSRF